MRKVKRLLRGVGRTAGKLAGGAPDIMKAFGGLAAAVMKDGALDKKTKELMAISISICIRCEGCIAYHTQNAIKAGASREEMVETIGVAVEMGGGPSTVYDLKPSKPLKSFLDSLSERLRLSSSLRNHVYS